MADHFAVGHAAGMAAGRAEAMAENATRAAAAIRDDSTVLSKSVFVVDSTAGSEARFILHVARDTFEEFVPALLWLTLIVAVTLGVTWLLTRLWGLCLRKSGAPENWMRMTQYALSGLLLFFGLTLAFGAVGVNFGQLFFGLSIVTAGAILSASDEIKNLTTGAKLASLRVLSRHHIVRIPAYGLVGELIDLGAFTSEIRPLERSADGGGDGGGDSPVSDETVLIDNRFIMSGPLYVQWHAPRPTSRPPRFVATDRRRGVVVNDNDVEAMPTAPFARSSRRFAGTDVVMPAAATAVTSSRDRAREMMLSANDSSASSITHRLAAARAAAVPRSVGGGVADVPITLGIGRRV